MTAMHMLVGISLSLAATSLASAQLVKFEFLDQSFNASDLTPDGKHVVGMLDGGGGYLWSQADGYTDLGGLGAVAVSDDGTIILGSIADEMAMDSVAAIWTAEDGWQSIGTLENPDVCGGGLSSPYDLSGDGSVAVGLGWQDGCNAYAFRWTPGNGMVAMELLGDGANRASAVSGDGNLLGGFAQGSFDRTPAIWSADGSGQLLDPPNGDVRGEVAGISDDGTTLLGEWNNKAFKLVEGEEIELFGTINRDWIGTAVDIADDGTIVGYDRLQLALLAWIRPNGGPTVSLREYLMERGVMELPPNLDACQAISANGNIIIGTNAFVGGWIVNLCVPDIDGDGQVAVTDLVAIIVAWGTDDPSADLNDDGIVDVSDLVGVIVAWGPCPY